MKRRQRVEHPVSAGGVVHRTGERGAEIVLCGSLSPPLWGLPKGTPEPGESWEETALREVCEETGLEVQIQRFIDSIEYWFVSPNDGVTCHKTVHFYLMFATGGDVSMHDHEFETVLWLPAPESIEIMTYDGEIGIVQKGLSLAPGDTSSR